MQKQIVLVLILHALIGTSVSNAQSISRGCYGRDMRGLAKLFVDTGDDALSRRNIIEVIKKEFPEMIIVEYRDQAEILIIYSYQIK